MYSHFKTSLSKILETQNDKVGSYKRSSNFTHWRLRHPLTKFILLFNLMTMLVSLTPLSASSGPKFLPLLKSWSSPSSLGNYDLMYFHIIIHTALKCFF